MKYPLLLKVGSLNVWIQWVRFLWTFKIFPSVATALSFYLFVPLPHVWMLFRSFFDNTWLTRVKARVNEEAYTYSAKTETSALEGSSIYLVGFSNNTLQEYTDMIESLGGKRSYVLDEHVTHVVVGPMTQESPRYPITSFFRFFFGTRELTKYSANSTYLRKKRVQQWLCRTHGLMPCTTRGHSRTHKNS